MPLIPVHETDLSQLPGDILPQIYNGFDTTQLHPILDKLLLLPRPGPIYNLERALQGVAMEMSLRGFLIDPLVQERETISLRSKLSTIDAVLQQLSQAIGNTSLNYDSPTQQVKFFYDVLGMRPITKRVKGELTYPMTQITLEKLQSFPRSRVFASLVLKCKEYRMLLNRFETEIDSDWRMRTSNNIAGTNERRWSNSKSALGTGGNLQNITEDLRSMFISDPGFKLFGVDKEQAEARWVGFYCGILLGDWTYLDLLESGDGHTAVARMVWPNDLPWTGDLKQDRAIAERIYPATGESYRQSAKKNAHGTNIGGRPPTIAAQLRISPKIVEDFQDRYFTALPCIPNYQTWVANKIQTTKFLRTVFGAHRDFFDRPDSYETVKKGLAFMQAGTSADDVNLGLYRTWKQFGKTIQLLTNEHDGVYGQFKDGENEIELLSQIQSLFKIEFDLGFRQFSVPTEAKTGYNKGMRYKLGPDNKPYDANPRGLDKPGAKR